MRLNLTLSLTRHDAYNTIPYDHTDTTDTTFQPWGPVPFYHQTSQVGWSRPSKFVPSSFDSIFNRRVGSGSSQGQVNHTKGTVLQTESIRFNCSPHVDQPPFQSLIPRSRIAV